MANISKQLKLTQKEYNYACALFKRLEIGPKRAIGKGYSELLDHHIREQYKKLVLVHHPDKGGDASRFREVDKAKKLLVKYIESLIRDKDLELDESLETDEPPVEAEVLSETDGLLTVEEFEYRRRLFELLEIRKEDVVGKGFKEIALQLEKKRAEHLTKTLKSKPDVECNNVTKEDPNLSKILGYFISLNEYLSPLKEKKSLIDEDKRRLVLQLLKHNRIVEDFEGKAKLLGILLDTVTIGYYFSWWIVPINLIGLTAMTLSFCYFIIQYSENKISTDEFTSKIIYISLATNFLFFFPLAAFSIYLVTTNFIAYGSTIGGTVFGTLLFLTLLMTEVLLPVFSKGCEIYIEKHFKDLMEENSKYKVQKETDLLEWYDPRRLLIPIIMPIVRICFAGFEKELSERNFNFCEEARTDMSNVKTEQQILQETAANGVNP